MSLTREIFIIFIIFSIMFVSTDYWFGKAIIEKIDSIRLHDNKSQISHSIYHHDMKKNLFKLKQKWGKLNYELCTNRFGFKSSCNNIIDDKDFDIVFIGDSFTEGVGLEYEDTFVGLFSNNYPELKVANMGVSSYSPSIYRTKIQYYLEQEKMTFNHVFVFIDISDIQDEALIYDRSKDNKVISQVHEETKSISIIKKLSEKTPILYRLLTKIYHFRDQKHQAFQCQPIECGLTTRAEWTHNPQSADYGKKGVSFGIDSSIHHMQELYKLLNERDIGLSIGIYPWPNQLKYDVEKNTQAKIWGDFCKEKCNYFINTMPTFFEYLQSNGYAKTYQDFYIYGDVHFNKNGNKIVFEDIQKSLFQNMDRL